MAQGRFDFHRILLFAGGAAGDQSDFESGAGKHRNRSGFLDHDHGERVYSEDFGGVRSAAAQKMGGVQVLVDGAECPPLFVSPNAIEAQLPFGITSEKTSFSINIVVRNADGEASIQTSLGKDAPKSYQTAFLLLVNGQEIARKDVTIPVQ